MNSQSIASQLSLLPDYLSSHLMLTLIALATGIVVCVPLGLLITRIKALQWPTLAVAGVLQTIPGLALLALMVPLLGTIGIMPALLALIVYSFLPILRNTVTGVINVDNSLIEAAHGLGMSDLQVLYKIELPLALPVIIAGIRTAAVWVVGTATLATPVGATSLGNFVFAGLQTQNVTAILIGCLAAAALAIAIDLSIRLVELAVDRRNLKLAVATVAVLLLLTAGGLSPVILNASESSGTGPVVIIGSKPFTEQYILAAAISGQLEANGFETDTRSGMGTMILFEALASGALDCYVDYTGTIWTNVMKRTDNPGREAVMNDMAEWLNNKYGIVCLGRLGFENTYGLAVRKEVAVTRDLETIEDLSRVASGFLIGSDYEFFSRPEWQALQKSYRLDFRQEITMDPVLMYGAIAQGDVDVISTYSTDGRIAAYNLQVLDDPRQALPPYDAVLLLSKDAATNNDLVEALEPMIGAINNSEMRKANKLVDLDGASIDSAEIFLRSRLSDSNL